jgi:pilus assembly protein Flp/PilA
MVKMLRRIMRDNRGATAVEYGLVVSLIIIAILASMSQLATNFNALWTNIGDQIVR